MPSLLCVTIPIHESLGSEAPLRLSGSPAPLPTDGYRNNPAGLQTLSTKPMPPITLEGLPTNTISSPKRTFAGQGRFLQTNPFPATGSSETLLEDSSQGS